MNKEAGFRPRSRNTEARDAIRTRLEAQGRTMFDSVGVKEGSVVKIHAHAEGKALPNAIQGTITAMLIERSTGHCYGFKIDDEIKIRFRNLDSIIKIA